MLNHGAGESPSDTPPPAVGREWRKQPISIQASPNLAQQVKTPTMQVSLVRRLERGGLKRRQTRTNAMYRAVKRSFRHVPGLGNSRGQVCCTVKTRCEGSRGRRGPRPWRRFIRIDVEHGISVLGGRPTHTPGLGSHRVTNARVEDAGCAALGYRKQRSKRPIPLPSLTKQGGAEPSGSRSLLIVVSETWETGIGRKPRSSEGGGPDNAPSEWTRSFNHLRA